MAEINNSTAIQCHETLHVMMSLYTLQIEMAVETVQ